MQVESSASPLLTIDEVENVQRQRVASLIGHVFQLTYAATVDKLIQEEKLNRCHGCAIQHPSQNQHSCLMMDNDDAWMYYHDEVEEQFDLNVILKTAESVCSALGFKLGKTWEAYVTELPKLPWTSIYLTSLELEDYGTSHACYRVHLTLKKCFFFNKNTECSTKLKLFHSYLIALTQGGNNSTFLLYTL